MNFSAKVSIMLTTKRSEMGRTKYRPTYSLEMAKRLTAEGSARMKRRATKFLIEHYVHADLVAADVFSKIEERHFRKSVELER